MLGFYKPWSVPYFPEIGFAKRVAHCVIFMDHGGIVEDDSREAFFANSRSERAQQFHTKILQH